MGREGRGSHSIERTGNSFAQKFLQAAQITVFGISLPHLHPGRGSIPPAQIGNSQLKYLKLSSKSEQSRSNLNRHTAFLVLDRKS